MNYDGDFHGADWAKIAWQNYRTRLERLAWHGFEELPTDRVRITGVFLHTLRGLPSDHDQAVQAAAVLPRAHFFVPARPAISGGRVVTLQVRDERKSEGTVGVRVGTIADGVVDTVSLAALQDLLLDYLLPRHDLKMTDVRSSAHDLREWWAGVVDSGEISHE